MPKARDDENPLPPAEELVASRMFNVAGKKILITGGGSGIGAMIASVCVGNGAQVVICSRKDSSRFAATLTERGPGRCDAIADIDLGKQECVDRLYELLHEKWSGQMDVLINNSGTNYSAPIESYKTDMFRKVIDLNLTVPFVVTQKFLPMLRRTPSELGDLLKDEQNRDHFSRVINITSINAERPPPFETYAYSSSKAGLRHLTQHMASRLAPEGILLNCIAPGSFMSRMMRGTIEAFGEENIAGQGAIKRLGTPQDIGGVVLLLSSRAGSWITGATIVLDGGALVESALSKL